MIDLRGWFRAEALERSASWVCFYCGDRVASRLGYRGGSSDDGSSQVGEAGTIRICPNCIAPTYFHRSGWHSPQAAPGRFVEHLPVEVATLYDNARRSAGAGAHTSSVLTCRKILMHAAVDKGAKAGDSFLSYVEYLAAKGYVPPGGEGWVDYIRKRGNEANHEIVLMTADDAEALIGFTEMLLRFVYELPEKAPKTQGTAE